VSPRRPSLLLLVAALFTGLNALKPLQIDDAALEWNAREIAAHPLDPFGFAMLWYDEPDEANDVLTPPVLPYYWAAVRRVVGERPWAWKLALFPWALLLVAALWSLLRRFARRAARPLLVLLVFSPAILPSFNLMLDIPALGLSLTAIDLFRRAADRRSFGRAVWAGVVAGVAMQTKYTAFTAPGVMLIYAGLTRRWAYWFPAALAATHVFISWELLTALLYGRSHFLLALGPGGGPLLEKLGVWPFLLGHLGGLAQPLLLLGLAALAVPRPWLAVAAGVLLAFLVLIALLDVDIVTRSSASALVFGPQERVKIETQLAEPLAYVVAAALVVVLALAGRLLVRAEWRHPRGKGLRRREGTFLLLWLGLEALAYVPLTPFPAARRALGAFVVIGLILGRLAALRERRLGRGLLRALAGGGAALGLFFFALDWYGARAQQVGAEEARRWIDDHGGGRVWYAGHWGFQFYSERAGMRPVIRDYNWEWRRDWPAPVALPPPSQLQEGDWLVLPDGRHNQQAVDWEAALRSGWLKEEHAVVVPGLPLRTVPCFYGGRVPLEHHEGPALTVRVYRVLAPFTPRPPPERPPEP
jgi:hypothetical protein